MLDIIRNILIGVATAFSVTSVGVCVNTYVDVQVLKSTQAEQKEFTNATREILSRIDKTQAVQTETIRAISDVVENLKHAREELNNDRRNRY